jgi:cardiolipin synthase
MFSTTATQYRWLRTGEDAFPPMLRAIQAATQSIRLEMYIYKAVPLGEQFREALVQARQRGVRVQVIIDALGSWNLTTDFWQPLIAAGGEVHWFNPLGQGRFAYRDHRKILVCDEEIAFVGGYNIAPEYCGDGVNQGWRDLGMQLRGPLAQALAAAFDRQITRCTFEHRHFTRFRKAQVRDLVRTRDGDLLLTGPGRGHNFLKMTLLNDLAHARQVQIICAYFLPPRPLRRALRQVVRRGGRTVLILPGKSDVAVSRLAARGFYQRLFAGNVEIYEYEPQILHSKLFLLDDIAYVGSANLDVRSLNLNYELMVRIKNKEVAAEGKEIFEQVLTNSRRIDPLTWANSRTIWSKLKERWAFFVLARVDPYLAKWTLTARP